MNWQKTRPHGDAVLVGDADSDGNGLDRFEVARLCLLFKFFNCDEYMKNQESYNLIYMQWFKKISHHIVNQMMIVEISDKFDIIKAEVIYYSIHLILKFIAVGNTRTTWVNHKAADAY